MYGILIGWTWEKILDKYIQMEKCTVSVTDMELGSRSSSSSKQHRKEWMFDADSMGEKLSHHGYSGPITTSRNPIVDPISELFIQAAMSIGNIYLYILYIRIIYILSYIRYTLYT